MNCVLCSGQGHHWTRCPLFGKPEEFLAAYAPKPLSPEELGIRAKDKSSTSDLEVLFGQDREQALADIMDSPGTSPEERTLALELLIGTKNIKKLDEQDRHLAEDMHSKLLFGIPRAPEQPSPPRAMPTRDTQKDSDFYSSVNYDFDRDPGNTPA